MRPLQKQSLLPVCHDIALLLPLCGSTQPLYLIALCPYRARRARHLANIRATWPTSCWSIPSTMIRLLSGPSQLTPSGTSKLHRAANQRQFQDFCRPALLHDNQTDVDFKFFLETSG